MQKQILFLRPFRSDPDHDLVTALAKATAHLGKLVIIGPAAGHAALRSHWDGCGDDLPPMADRVEYIECVRGGWKTVVHQKIVDADCVLLFLTPKGKHFPALRRRRHIAPPLTSYRSAPFKKPSTGIGLLYEVSYLHRLGKTRKTVILCRSHESDEVTNLIHRNSAEFLVFRPNGNREPRAAFPRLYAADRQLARLSAAAGIVAFAEGDLDGPSRGFARPLRSAVSAASRHSATTAPGPLPLGVSPDPRALPPDGALKVISHTNVENLLAIPAHEITEVPAKVARTRLKRRAAWRGCPACRGGLSTLFFYHGDGLGRDPGEDIWAKCQRCMARLYLEERALIEV